MTEASTTFVSRFSPLMLRGTRRGVLAALLLALAGNGLPVAAADVRMVSIDRAQVNMRSGPGTRFEILWNLARGYPLQVLARSQGWLKVRDFENDVGWVLARLTSRKPHLVVKTEVLNLRRGPGTGHRIVGQAAYGEVLHTLEHEGSWVHVRRQPDGPSGWVARRLTWGW